MPLKSIGLLTLFCQYPHKRSKVLNNLRELDLSDNQLKEVPASLGELREVRILNFSKNLLESVPASLGHLACLVRLRLSDNRLKRLPDSFRNMKVLKRIALDKNRFKFVPCLLEELVKSGDLWLIDLLHNRFLGEDGDIEGWFICLEGTIECCLKNLTELHY